MCNDEGKQCKLLPCNLAIFLKYQSLNPNSSTDDNGSRWLTTIDLIGQKRLKLWGAAATGMSGNSLSVSG